MPPSLFFSANFYGFHKKPSNPPLQDNISLSHAPLLRDKVVQDDRTRPKHNYWRPLCYFLHVFLVVLHLVLMAVAASHHAERRVVMTYDQAEALTTPLSVGLQAFYILYTAFLVFVTQRLALSAIFSSSRKLTHIHDLCGAWSGVGAALSALWQQTKVTSSVLSISLVALYFACISVLQITSSTLIQLQMSGGHPVTDLAAVVRTWPNASVDLGSLKWMAMAPLAPFLQEFFVWGTSGLVNNTIYDYMGTDDLLTATVDATTLNANCGLLTNLSVDASEDGVWYVQSSMPGLDPIGVMVSSPPLFNEIWYAPSIQCMGSICSDFILFLVSTEMQVDDSVSGADPVYVNGTYYYYDGATQNFSTPISLVACSLDTTNQTITLDSSGNPVGSGNQPADLEWSSFSVGGDLNLTSAISHAMEIASSLPPSPYCQPIMSIQGSWAYIPVFQAYMRSILGMGVSPCDDSNIAQYASPSSPLTRDQMESAVSQIAAEFMWLGGQLGGAGGGFDPQELVTPISGIAELWSLNINPVPVVFALGASVILLMLVFHILRRLPAGPAVVSGSSVLEIMWFGSRSQVLRDHLRNEETASLEGLRAWAISKTVFWMRPAIKGGKTSDTYPVVPFVDVETDSESSKYLGLLGSENRQMSHGRFLHSRSNLRCMSRRLCYILHIVLVALHVALLALLIHHPELSVIFGDSKTPIMIGLGAALQAFYTLYSALLIFLMQRLALSKIANERRKLTTVHDLSGAWTGIGAAVDVLWQQRIVSSSVRDVFMVASYLTMMLVLNIASSSIMQWRWHQNPALVEVNVQTNLAMPDDTVDISQLGWTEIFPIVRLIQDEELTTTGLFNNTIYDIAAQSSQRSAWEVAPVNTTTLTAQCGLVPNLTLTYLEDEEVFQISFQNGTDQGSFIVLPPILENVIQAILPITECAACLQTQFYLFTTAINLDGSVDDTVVVNLNWTLTGSVQILARDTLSANVSAYIAACSLSAQTDLVSPEDVNQTSNQAPPASTAWSVWSPEDATNLSVGMVTAFSTATLFSPEFTDMGNYFMSLLGLNTSFVNETLATLSGASPSVTLSPWQLENAIAQTAATFLWTAGLVGESGGGFQRSTGETQGLYAPSPGWRLQLNPVPVIFAFVASSISLFLVVMIIGRGPSRDHPSSVSGTSVLECLWLEAHSDLLHAHLQAVEEPRLQTLRRAGMFEMCLGDIGWVFDVEGDGSSLELDPRSAMSNVMLHVRGLSGRAR